MPKLRSRVLAVLLSAAMTSPVLPPPVHAGIIGTHAAVATQERARVAALLEREDVAARLLALGVPREEVHARVAALSDAEIAELAARIDASPAGGNGIVGALLLVFLILLATDLLGWTKVFPFTRQVK